MACLMQARSSSDGQLYVWRVSDVDFSGTGFPGPGSPLDITLSVRGRIAKTQAVALQGIASAMAFGAIGVGTTPAFPSTVTSSDIIAWFDGSRQAYSDSAGTVPQNTILGNVYRINEASPLTGNWQAVSSAQQARRDAYGLRFDVAGSTNPAQMMVRSAVAPMNLNNSTMVISFLMRDGTGGPQMGLAAASSVIGAWSGGGGLGVYYANTPWQTALSVPRGQRCTVVIRWLSTGVKVSLLTGGVTTSDALTTSISSGTASSPIYLGFGFGSPQGLYGSIDQCVVINRAVSDTERDQLLAWGDAKQFPEAYPVGHALLGVMGDSIARNGVGLAAGDGWCWKILPNLRAVDSGTEECNVAVVGSGVGLSTYTPLAPFYSPLRRNNLSILATGTNDLANGNSTSFTTSGLYSICAAARADGWKVALATVLPRNGLFGAGVTQASFAAARAIVNADIRANWASHADALADVAAITNLGADGDTTNTTYYQVDQVHPTAAGHALMEPVYRAAALSMMT